MAFLRSRPAFPPPAPTTTMLKRRSVSTTLCIMMRQRNSSHSRDRSPVVPAATPGVPAAGAHDDDAGAQSRVDHAVHHDVAKELEPLTALRSRIQETLSSRSPGSPS
jgi:hypothetical protein